MTNEEAARHLLTYSTTIGSGQTTQAEHVKAKALAIKALEAQRSGAWEWDSYYGGFYRCSACGYEQGRKTKYCPECGARMTEVHDDDKV